MALKDADPGLTPHDLEAIRRQLIADRDRLLAEVSATESEIAGLVADSGDGSGDDLVDAGSKAFEREHEMALADVARDSLLQVTRALGRLDDNTYGDCETCGKPISRERLLAFPRATQCLACKAAEERG
ncbi:MAG: TraR/DksA C4-type zinc finger protein [Candidatus Nanopelagicales bacterium]|nr:TraR/DksA C4-type zinc finger protein [Candidatus Nanopelagicales bacterium]